MKREEQEDKLAAWLNRHRGLLIKVARSFVRESHDQNHLLQEIAIQIWKSIPSYRPIVKETTWLYRVALYTAINWNRKETRRRTHVREVNPKLLSASTIQWAASNFLLPVRAEPQMPNRETTRWH